MRNTDCSLTALALSAYATPLRYVHVCKSERDRKRIIFDGLIQNKDSVS